MNENSKQPASTTINDWLRLAVTRLTEAGIPSARLDAELILSHVLHKERAWLLAHDEEAFADPTLRHHANTLLTKRLHRMPLAYLLGTKEFYGREFIVTRDVLIPRPESETLIELAKKYKLSGKIIDVGTGSGCLGITLALETGSDVTASDVSEDALEIAMTNAARYGVRATFGVSHLLSRWKGYTFDAIVANLPYVDETWDRSPETNYEPTMALFADDDGLSLIKRLIEQAPGALIPGGFLLLEADPSQHDDIIKTGAAHGLRFVETKDYIVVLQAA